MQSDTSSSTTQQAEQQLCSRCATLDVGNLLDRHLNSKFEEEVQIWSWNDYQDPDWLHPQCSFCQLVGVIKKPHDTSQAGLWYFSPPEYLYLLPNPKSTRPVPLGLKKEPRMSTVGGSSKLWRDKDGRTWRTWTLFLASRGSVHGQGQLVIRNIDSKRVDFDILRSWLARDGASTTSQRPISTPNSPARLIDCHTMTIVTASCQPYLALSYVWGTTTPEADGWRAQLGGPLPERIPLTIADAISVTKELGYQYLWVDKYTIDQEDEISKLHDIQNMDTIFESADATLVAAAGKDANHGIPGAGDCSRTPTLKATISTYDFVVVFATSVIQDAIRQSKWNSRAWTFQEKLLSKRLLIFTEHEVYFESRQGNSRETVEAPFANLDANLFISQKPWFDPWNAYNPEWVNETIAEYSSRDLSRQKDALLAALGFLKKFRNGPNPVYHHWGVPIFPDQAIGLSHGRTKFPYLGPKAAEPFSAQGFLLGLCWRPAGNHLSGNKEMTPARRRGLPSWSWTGWSCPLDSKPHSVYDIQQFHAHPEDKVYVELGEGEHFPIQRLYDPGITGRMSSHDIFLDVQTIPLRLERVSRAEMTPSMQDQYPEPWALTCGEVSFPFCYGGWGSRTDSFISLVMATGLWENEFLASTRQFSLLGIFLGRFEDKKDWPFGKQFILVVREHVNGSFCERIGHISQGDQRVGMDVRTILRKHITRRRVRIG